MFSASRDAAFELIDAIASSPHASSAVAVSESPLMQRGYASVYKGLERMRFDEDKLRQVLVNQADRCGELLVEGYVIQALDHTPYPRRSAPTVTDRGFVHGANGQVVGHQYSLLGRVMHASGAWVGIEDCMRIPTCKTPVQVGAEQVARLRQSTPADRKYIITADSEYLTCDLLDQADARIALLIRLKNNRVLFHRPPPRLPAQSGQRPLGRPTQHGQRVKLSDASTLGQPDQAHSMPTDDGGHVEISVFKDLHVRSHPQVHRCVIRIRVLDAAGGCKFPRPMWLFWSGPHDLDWRTFWRVYLKRFCLEAVHQFAKNALAWTSARLGNTDREERWSWLVVAGRGWSCWLTGNFCWPHRCPTMSANPGKNPPRPDACRHPRGFNATTGAFS